MRTISGMTTTRKKTGPKLERPGLRVDPVTYSVDDLTRRRLRVLGRGNESLGLRLAAAETYRNYQVKGSLPALSDDGAAPAVPAPPAS